MSDLDPGMLADYVIGIAERAGGEILNVYQGDFHVETKDDDSPLTAADRAAHACISLGLRELTPQVPVLSEEDGFPDFEERRHWPRYWLVDPLDGTKEFIKRNGEFTVNIALVEDGVPVLGVVHAPVLARSYLGVLGEGAERRDEGGRTRIATRALGDAPLTLVVSRSHRDAAVDRLLERLPACETTSVGSSLKFCLVAEGLADLYPRFGPTSEWDTAAAQCLVEAAGGAVTRVDGTPLRYNRKASVLNPDFLAYGDPAHDWTRYLEGFALNER
ncbi:3'(2'),5'-bisphosphate nucleotidase CysQ [Sediminicurvatus halobius]|uniref:3'(2'),5'-bisphosphate nucleotidase CysQ n=1 Tax=Sediminicurvatus halobius TaxID=2182432 RepID=A0A2U2N1P7_9GAMM|nr:3'(2'),5'-bisphosphate nucleotidase CysQ [Spiribacter halobius]PWG62987.1 3'(2'),5'-bisphosphate nucleotidase [Spiribacter halobius]UEX77504.1 3'(2'),5'-bisphosphate nucleotidase CysQ [Spiribacter halobius]